MNDSKVFNTLKIAFLYFVVLCLFSIGCIAAFWSEFLIDSEGLFFRAAGIIIVFAVILFFILSSAKFFRLWWFKLFVIQDIFLVCLIFITVNWQIYGLIPFNATRSNSIILLDYLYFENGNPVTVTQINDYVSHMYFVEYNSVDVRLKEQMNSGNVDNIDGKWVITEKGRKTARIMSFITNLYNPSKSYFIHVK